jgi:hypothetical protein
MSFLLQNLILPFTLTLTATSVLVTMHFTIKSYYERKRQLEILDRIEKLLHDRFHH